VPRAAARRAPPQVSSASCHTPRTTTERSNSVWSGRRGGALIASGSSASASKAGRHRVIEDAVQGLQQGLGIVAFLHVTLA
jgi:hypothetical protein